MSGTAAVVLAGGSGSRSGRAGNKVYLPAGGRPLLAWSLRTFQQSPLIARIILVVRGVDRAAARAVLQAEPTPKLQRVLQGGASRHDSEHAGLEALATAIESAAVDLVCIHDAARPFVAPGLIARVLEAARRTGGGVPGLPLSDPVLLRSEGAQQPSLVPTADLRLMQTPQAFRALRLLQAFRRAAEAGFTGVDTAETAQRFSDLQVEVVEGDPDNVKVTYAEDLAIVEELAAVRLGRSHGG